MQRREQKTEIITIRVSPQQKAALVAAAEATGLSVSALLLHSALQAARNLKVPHTESRDGDRTV